MALLSLGTLLVRLPAFMLHVQTACAGSPCAYGQLTSPTVAALQRVGLSLGEYAAFQITLPLLWAVLSLALAGLIVWRKSDDWMALLVLALIVLWPTGTVTGVFSLGTYATLDGSQFPAPLVNVLIRFGFFLVFSLFPTGRVVSRWTLILVGMFLAEEISYNFLSFWPLGTTGWPSRFAELLWLATLLSLVPIQRYRYRLWDVDVLINKALVYGGLWGTLGALYVVLIIGLQSLLGRFSAHTTQPAVIVISTLAIAALFQPLRRRIQHLIDRRFYRKKYDAAKTLAAFSTTLRNEVDLEQLTTQLIDVVNETMQPWHASLWLRSPERHTEGVARAADTQDTRPEKLSVPGEIEVLWRHGASGRGQSQ